MRLCAFRTGPGSLRHPYDKFDTTARVSLVPPKPRTAAAWMYGRCAACSRQPPALAMHHSLAWARSHSGTVHGSCN